ncbi:MAG: ABC transporter substrate-binding protein [Brachymonas sp.]|nr:ABC transporter substrate-binding protein [Brachymonas sp.]
MKPSKRIAPVFWGVWLAALLGLSACRPAGPEEAAGAASAPAPAASAAQQAQAGAGPERQTAAAAAGSAASAMARSRAVAASIQQPVRRIVVLNSDGLEALRLLEADDRVVGVFSGITHEAGLWPEKAKLPHVGRWSEPNVEAIAQLKPDVVIHYHKSSAHLEDRLRPLGIKVLRMDFYKVHTLEQEMSLLGELLGRPEQARRFNAWHRGILQRVQQQLSGLPAKARVYLENYSDYSAAGPGSGLHELCDLAGCLNIAAGLKTPYPKVTPEWVVAAKPDMLLKVYGKVDGYTLQDAGEYNRIRQQMMARPAWQHIQAVRAGQVHVVDGSLTSGPRVGVAVAYIAHWLYPQQMQSIDPDALHQEYLERFMRVPFKGRYFSDPAQNRASS